MQVLSPAQTPQQVAWSAGTADAVRQFSWLLEPLVGRNRYIEDILVLYSDQMYNIDFRPALKFHQQSDADVTVIARPCDEAGAEGLGLLKLERGSPRVVKVRCISCILTGRACVATCIPCMLLEQRSS